MQIDVIIVLFTQVTLLRLNYVGALRGNCSVDVAVTYSGNNVLYLFKGDKYARWNDAEDKLEYVNGKL